MNLGLAGKVALVCGASSGMGKAIAVLLAREGAHVAILARRAPELKKVASDIRSESDVRTLPIVADLSRLRSARSIVERVVKRLGGLHILINNAGGPPPGGLFDVADSDWETAYRQNLRSVIALTQEAIPVMRKQRFGRILNIASQVVKEPPPGMILSNTMRAGVVAFAKSISHQIAADNITINTLLPGAIMTDRIESLIAARAKREGRKADAVREEMRQANPSKRIGTPEEFAAVAVFLASEQASYVTGTTLAVDGGITRSLI